MKLVIRIFLRHQLPGREVARDAEDDHHAWGRVAVLLETDTQRVQRRLAVDAGHAGRRYGGRCQPGNWSLDEGAIGHRDPASAM